MSAEAIGFAISAVVVVLLLAAAFDDPVASIYDEDEDPWGDGYVDPRDRPDPWSDCE